MVFPLSFCCWICFLKLGLLSEAPSCSRGWASTHRAGVDTLPAGAGIPSWYHMVIHAPCWCSPKQKWVNKILQEFVFWWEGGHTTYCSGLTPATGHRNSSCNIQGTIGDAKNWTRVNIQGKPHTHCTITLVHHESILWFVFFFKIQHRLDHSQLHSGRA